MGKELGVLRPMNLTYQPTNQPKKLTKTSAPIPYPSDPTTPSDLKRITITVLLKL